MPVNFSMIRRAICAVLQYLKRIIQIICQRLCYGCIESGLGDNITGNANIFGHELKGKAGIKSLRQHKFVNLDLGSVIAASSPVYDGLEFLRGNPEFLRGCQCLKAGDQPGRRDIVIQCLHRIAGSVRPDMRRSAHFCQ